MITCVPAASSRSTVALAVSVVVSPESPGISCTGWPRTPPAALTSLTASWVPATSGGPRKARLPVSGRRVPILRGAVTGVAPAFACCGTQLVDTVVPDEPPVPPVPVASLLPELHPARARDVPPSTAATRTRVRFAIQTLLVQRCGGSSTVSRVWNQTLALLRRS